jgi:hypothetical protein
LIPGPGRTEGVLCPEAGYAELDLSPLVGDFGLMDSISVTRYRSVSIYCLNGKSLETTALPSNCGRTVLPFVSAAARRIARYFSGVYSCTQLEDGTSLSIFATSSSPNVTQPFLALDFGPKSSRRRVPRQKFSIMAYSCGGKRGAFSSAELL